MDVLTRFISYDPRLYFVPHAYDCIDCRADINDAGIAHCLGKVGTLGQKAISRMNGIDTVILHTASCIYKRNAVTPLSYNLHGIYSCIYK